MAHCSHLDPSTPCSTAEQVALTWLCMSDEGVKLCLQAKQAVLLKPPQPMVCLGFTPQARERGRERERERDGA